MRAVGVLLALLAAVAMTSCDQIANRIHPPLEIVPLEVWNRTLDDVFLVDLDGRLMGVPACGHAAAAPMKVAQVEIRMDAGRINTFGSQGPPGPLYLIVVAAAGDMSLTDVRPVAVPVCAGHPTPVP